jgi:hypothetical protein
VQEIAASMFDYSPTQVDIPQKYGDVMVHP